MKAMLIRVAIMLFVRWLKEHTRHSNGLIQNVLEASTYQQFIEAFEHKRTEKDISNIVCDIESKTTGNDLRDLIGK